MIPQAVRAGPVVSVAMCTYNGAAYLEAQLASIAAQSMLPNELVVFDDASSDDSARIVQRFASEAPFAVTLTVNNANLGATKNFEEAIRACRGDLIVLADQDDVWSRVKIERLVDNLAENRTILAFSDAELVDQYLHPLGRRLLRTMGFTSRERRLFAKQPMEVLLRHNVVTGATTAFRSDLREHAFPVPSGWVHDGWLALVASMMGRAAFIEEPLILYRQHPSNLIGAPLNPLGRLTTSRADYVQRIKSSVPGWERAIQIALTVAPGSVPKLEAKVAFLNDRLALPSGRWARIPRVLNALRRGAYHRFARGTKSAVADVVLS